ncbi:MAG: hypothetical protein CMK59_13730 [Proteobacteria bacterium]|nr:hypothetical protein [Pseudomonadota bacterium]
MFLLLLNAWADVPLPNFPNCFSETPEECPSDLRERWYLLDYVPEHAQESVRPEELELGSGNRLLGAWRRTSGSFDVLLGIMDSGIKWSKEDVTNKWFLNIGELPLPQNAEGDTAQTYDLNGDGVVNLEDYENDPRVAVDAGPNGDDEEIDVNDLIYTFSDGVDDDENGFVDDVSGWDFFERDNDAYHTFDEGYGTHGDGVARSAAAEGNNGGGIGVCPNCAILPLRVGDTFVTDGARAAEAIAYGVQMNAASITMAIGSLGTSAGLERAVELAYEQGTLLVGAAGDENSYHHNFPAVLNNVVFVHSVSHNTGDDDGQVYSYFNTWNCNNFGSRMDLVAAEGACATGAVAQTVGAIGMLQSAALDNDTELSAGEVYQILIQSATDVNLTEEERAQAKAYPSNEGWDPFYGYGRLDVGAAVERVYLGEIPPGLSVDYPEWFQTFDADQVDVIPILAEVNGRESIESWSVEYAFGNNPQDWIELESGTGSEIVTELSIDDIPLTKIREADVSEDIVERLNRVYEASVTLKVTAQDATGQQAVMRKTFFVHHDSGIKAGFPKRLEGSGEASPIFYDVDGNGAQELVVCDGNGAVHAYEPLGEELNGFPVYTDLKADVAPSPAFDVDPLRDTLLASPAAGDIDGDGDGEIVALGFDGGVYAWHHDGSVVSGFPQYSIGRTPEELTAETTFDQGFIGSPTLVDIDGDNTLEIVASGLDSRLYVFTHEGEYWGDYPIELCYPSECETNRARSINSPSVGDIDGDGDMDIVVGTNEAVINETSSVTYAIDALSAEYLEGWPLAVRGLVGEAVLLPLVGEGHPATPALADIDGDGDLEIASPVMLGMNRPIHHDGTEALPLSFVASDFPDDIGADVASLVQMASQPSWGDLNGDGVPEHVTPAVSALYLASLASRTWMDYQQPVGAWDGVTGEMLNGWPRQIEDITLLSGSAIADVSGDGKPEVIVGSAGYLVHAWDGEGREASGWPKITANWNLATVAVGDLDGDGYLDVAGTTREGWLFVWETQGRADQKIEWASLHHDAQNTGNYQHPIPLLAGPPDQPITEEGCCKKDSSEKSSFWLALPLMVVAFRRRKHVKQ